MTDADDDDMGAMWREHKAERAAKRADNREASIAMLAAAAVTFETRNDGAHLIVHDRDQRIDFWPGTGLWIRRGQQKRHRGVRNLLQALGRNP